MVAVPGLEELLMTGQQVCCGTAGGLLLGALGKLERATRDVSNVSASPSCFFWLVVTSGWLEAGLCGGKEAWGEMWKDKRDGGLCCLYAAGQTMRPRLRLPFASCSGTSSECCMA